ncbi:MAG TPA: hypothetical protein VGR51_06795, partial [Thermoplasmata archaeon]|nr:hypothetical protein [Thermoplasmata archaeon]
TSFGVVYNHFDLLVHDGRLKECIASLEDCLRSLRETPYHAVLGRNFLGQTDAAVEYIGSFFETTSKTIQVKALYFEMNGFEINPEEWYFNGFAFKEVGDLDWLSAWDGEPGEDFVLTGMEPVQKAFAEH